jgi:hypothetical protein
LHKNNQIIWSLFLLLYQRYFNFRKISALLLLVSKAIGSLRWGLPFQAKRRNGGKFQWRSAEGRLPSKSRFFAYFFLKKVREKIFIIAQKFSEIRVIISIICAEYCNSILNNKLNSIKFYAPSYFSTPS